MLRPPLLERTNSHAGTPPSFNVIMLRFRALVCYLCHFHCSYFRSYLFIFVHLFAAMALSLIPAATKRQTIALVGFGNLAKFICEEISADDRFALVVISRQVCSFAQDWFTFHHQICPLCKKRTKKQNSSPVQEKMVINLRVKLIQQMKEIHLLA